MTPEICAEPICHLCDFSFVPFGSLWPLIHFWAPILARGAWIPADHMIMDMWNPIAENKYVDMFHILGVQQSFSDSASIHSYHLSLFLGQVRDFRYMSFGFHEYM